MLVFWGGAEGNSPLSQAGEVRVKLRPSPGELWKVKRLGNGGLSTHPTCSLLLAASRGRSRRGRRTDSVRRTPVRLEQEACKACRSAEGELSSAGLTVGRSCRAQRKAGEEEEGRRGRRRPWAGLRGRKEKERKRRRKEWRRAGPGPAGGEKKKRIERKGGKEGEGRGRKGREG